MLTYQSSGASSNSVDLAKSLTRIRVNSRVYSHTSHVVVVATKFLRHGAPENICSGNSYNEVPTAAGSPTCVLSWPSRKRYDDSRREKEEIALESWTEDEVNVFELDRHVYG